MLMRQAKNQNPTPHQTRARNTTKGNIMPTIIQPAILFLLTLCSAKVTADMWPIRIKDNKLAIAVLIFTIGLAIWCAISLTELYGGNPFDNMFGQANPTR
jgi:hypothetical protein